MSRRTLLLLALVPAVTAGGCHFDQGVNYRGAFPSGQPSPEPGEQEAYWIWQDGAGWHLRTTSDAPHHFRGEVEAVGGELSGLTAVGLAPAAVRQDGSTVAFDFRGSGKAQGFDWTSSSGCSRFEIYIDGATRPLRVFLGMAEESPYRVPFTVCG